MSETCSSVSSSDKKIMAVVIFDNTHGMNCEQKQLDVAKYQQLLVDPGQVDCPLLARLGYPMILVSTKPGQKCIPAVQYPCVSNNKHNNRMATTAAARVTTGLAMGCVVGNVYAIRTDGQDFTYDEWWEIWDVLCDMMGAYGGGPGAINDRFFHMSKLQLRRALENKGLLKHSGAGSGRHCLACGEGETDENKLLHCAQCKTARYCSRECQKAHWRAGHKQTCKPSNVDSEALKVKQLLETAVLKPEQIIEREAALPDLPSNIPPNMAMLARVMPPEQHAVFVYNKFTKKDERICPACMTRYRLLTSLAPEDRAAKEQKLSGLCSFACFRKFSPDGGPNSGPDWYGQEAEQPEGVVFGSDSDDLAAGMLGW